jgi:hypothetical protein
MIIFNFKNHFQQFHRQNTFSGWEIGSLIQGLQISGLSAKYMIQDDSKYQLMNVLKQEATGMSLEVKINSIPLELGEIVDMAALDGAELHKAGPLARLLKHIPSDQTIYLADNCKLECFDEEFCIYPCTHDYLNRDRQWETKATIFLEGGRVWKLEFQVVDGRYAATNFLDRFYEACSAVLGEPVESSRYRTEWRNGKAKVTSILHRDKVNADFLIELQEN